MFQQFLSKLYKQTTLTDCFLLHIRADHKMKHHCIACGWSHIILAGAPAEATAAARLVVGASVGALVASAAVLALALQEGTQNGPVSRTKTVLPCSPGKRTVLQTTSPTRLQCWSS